MIYNLLKLLALRAFKQVDCILPFKTLNGNFEGYSDLTIGISWLLESASVKSPFREASI